MIVFDHSKCTGCGVCRRVCLNRVIELENGKAGIAVPVACNGCAHCLAVCPAQAIYDDARDMTEVLPYNAATFRVEPERLLNLMKYRRTVRAFRPDPVPEDVLARVLAAGRWSPTARNLQKNGYIIVRKAKKELERLTLDFLCEKGTGGLGVPADPEKQLFDRKKFRLWRDEFAADPENADPLYFGAPLIILVTSPVQLREDAAAAGAYMELQAAAEGLGCLYSGFTCGAIKNSAGARQLIGLPEDRCVVRALVMGYPAVKYLRTVPRRAADVSFV